MNTLQRLIEKYPDKDWDWTELSRNPCITPDFVERHMDKGWFWNRYALSLNPSVTLDFIEKHLDKDWQWGTGGLSENYFCHDPYIKAKQQTKSEKDTFREYSPFLPELTYSISSYL